MSTTSGKREQRKAITRTELLAAARELFGQRGLYESSVEDLTRRAGIAKGTLYLYFGSKEELIQAVLIEGFDSLYQRLSQEIGSDMKLAPLIERITQTHIDFLDQNPDLMRIFHQARGMLKFKRSEWLRLRGPLQTHIQRLADLFKNGNEGRKLSPTQRRELALFCFGTVSGVVSMYASIEGASLRSRKRRILSRALALAGAEINRTDHRERSRSLQPPNDRLVSPRRELT